MSTETVDIIVRETGASAAGAGIRGVGVAADETAASVDGLNAGIGKLEGLMLALGLSLGIRELIDLSDTFAEITNKLRLTATSTQDLVDSEQKLFEISQQTRQDLQGTVDLYSAMTIATKNLNKSQADLMGVVTTVNQAMTLSGKSGEEVTGAMRRFSLSLSQGTLDGRGLTTVLLQFPALARAIAEGLNVDVGSLKALAAQGGITSTMLVDALQKSAPSVEAKFKTMEVTIRQAFTQLHNSLLQTIGIMDQVDGVSGKVANGIIFLASNMTTIVKIVSILSAALTAYGVSTGIAAAGSIRLFAIIAANPLTTAIVIFTALAAAVMAFGNDIKLTADGSITLLGALSGAFQVLKGIVLGAYNWFIAATGGANESNIAFRVLKETITILAAALTVFMAIEIAGALVTMTKAAYGLVASFGLIALEVTATVAAVLGLMYAVSVMTIGFDNANKMVASLGDTLVQIKDKISSGLTAEMVKATEAMKAASVASGEVADSLGGGGHGGTGGLSPHAAAAAASMNALGSSAAAAAPAFTQIQNSVTASGTAIQTTSTYVNGLNGGLVETGQTIKSVGNGVERLTTQIVGMNGSMMTTAETMTKTTATTKTTSQSLIDMDGNLRQVSSTVENILAPALDAGKAKMDAMAKAAEADAAQMANFMGGMSALAGFKPGSAPGGGFGDNSMAFAGKNWGGYMPGGGTSGADYGGYGLGAYATGGSFIVGGSGGTDSQMVQFMATPGEKVSVDTPAQMAANRFVSASVEAQTEVYRGSVSTQSGNGGGGGPAGAPIVVSPIHVHMAVSTPNAQSFAKNTTAITAALANKITRVQSKLGRNG